MESSLKSLALKSRSQNSPRILQALSLWLLLLCPTGLLAAEVPSAGTRTPLWPGAAPASNAAQSKESAFVTVFKPSHPTGAAVVICPGGGYGGLMVGPEGTGIARWLNEHGITGIVLEYRLPHGDHRVPLLDAQRALRLARARAGEWSCDPHRIGIMGFSAGGHLASTAATHFDSGNPNAEDPVDRMGCRPDFAILVYPVITMGEKTHGGSKANLLGPKPTDDLVLLYSNEKQVTEKSSPSFLAHALDDRAVPSDNSRLFHDALVAHHVPSRYLELPSGDHGLNGYKGPMWDAWQSQSLQWLASLKIIPQQANHLPSRPTTNGVFPSYRALENSPQQVHLLPGKSEFVFSLYAAPADLAPLKQLVEVLKQNHLANGFDPGPSPTANATATFEYLTSLGWPVVFYSGGEMQIKGGRSVFGPAEEAMLKTMDAAGIFSAYQLGEWGYYFHNLSPNEPWWRDVYGKEFEAFRHLMKPKGLAGYDHFPSGKKECYDVVRDYFQSRSRDLLGRVISVTGHSHYEAYVAEWGARCIGLEVAENIAFTQSKFAFARGASRQWSTPWSVQVSPWFSGACTTSGPLRQEGGNARGLDAGHSLSLYERLWLHGWFCGAAMVTPENSIAIFFEKAEAPWALTPHGKKAAELFQFMQSHDRGIPYAPVAIVLDRFAGYNGYMDKPWGILNPTAGDRELRDLFDHQLFPGADFIRGKHDSKNPESGYLRPTPSGEIYDVLLSSTPPEVLPSYPVILLAGDIEFHPSFLSELEKSLRRGSRVLMSPRHRDALGSEFARLERQGKVEVLDPWINPVTGRPSAISNSRLSQLAKELLPFEIQGDEVGYQVNRTLAGWAIELINNRGVVKKPGEAAMVDPQAIAHVRLQSKVRCSQAVEWRSGRIHRGAEVVELDLGPGAVEYVEWTERPSR